MLKYTKVQTGAWLLVLTLTLNTVSFHAGQAASITSGTPCKTQLKGKIITLSNGTFKCKKTRGTFQWIVIKQAELKPAVQKIPEPVEIRPTWIPGVDIKLEGTRVTANVSILSKADALLMNCKEVETVFNLDSGVGLRPIGTRSSSLENVDFSRNIVFSFWIDVGQFLGDKIVVQAFCKNGFERGESASASIELSTPSASPTPTESVNLTNAKRSAAGYLNYSSFSRIGLIKQLVYEGFSNADAEVAVDSQNVDWREQAAKTAASYLKYSAYSYAGLLRQLEYEGFTNEQAVFGVSKTGLTASGTPAPAGSTNDQAQAQTTQPVAGCAVTYLSPLPYANQKIAISGIEWERDSQGYVTANLTMRNDNSMALRMVNFIFHFFHKGTLIKTTSTLEGDHHFFIQDDPKFNGLNGPAGAWLPNQTRVFKIPSNQILDCNSITVLSSGFLVKQGIGAS